MEGSLPCSLVHPNYPMQEWDRLIPQGNITLNLLQASCIDPQLSAYTGLFGQFDFNRTPLAPPGTKVVFHSKPSKRASWVFHGQEGWYIELAMDHYHNITAYFPETRSEKVTNTVTFVPHNIPVPNVTLEDYLVQAVETLYQFYKMMKIIPYQLFNWSCTLYTFYVGTSVMR